MGEIGEAVKVSACSRVLYFARIVHIAVRELGYNQQALYCYGKLYSLDPTNVTALWDRATLAKEIGELRIVRPFPYVLPSSYDIDRHDMHILPS